MLLVVCARAHAPPGAHETEAETMARCLAELASPDVQARRRAILVIGKYENPEADDALLRSLRDEDAMVRRSALVSFSERRGMPQEAGQAILDLLADPDVHIRRIASAMLPELLLRLRILQPRPDTPGALVPPRTADAAQNHAAPIMARLNQALADPDPVVVKNVLDAADSAPAALDAEAVLGCLESPDREVRVLALQSIRRLRLRREPNLIEWLAPLAKDQDGIVRRELAATLALSGNEGLPVLRTLADDSVPAVRLEAGRQLALLRDRQAPAILARLLGDPQIDPESRARLIGNLLLFREPVDDLLRQLADSGPAVLRAAAIRAFANPRVAENAPPPRFFLALAEEPQRDIRQAATYALLALHPELDVQTSRQLLRSKHPDVRLAGLSSTRNLPAEQARELLIDACLDEDLDVRAGALQQLAAAQVPGWEEILVQTLHDPEPRMRQTALDIITRSNSQAVIPLLEQFLKTCRDQELARAVHQRILHLRQRNPQQPPTRTPLRPPVRH